MKHIQNFIFLEMAILAIGALISNHNKIEVILGSVTPFFIYTTETSFYINATDNLITLYHAEISWGLRG